MADWRNKPINTPYIDGNGNYSITLHYQSEYEIDTDPAFWTWQNKKEMATYAFVWVSKYFGRDPASVPKEMIEIANKIGGVSVPPDITGLEVIGDTVNTSATPFGFDIGMNPFRNYSQASRNVSRDAARVVSITDPTFHLRPSAGDYVDKRIFAFKVTFLKQFIESLDAVSPEESRYMHPDLKNAEMFAAKFSIRESLKNESGPILSVINKPVVQFTQSTITSMYNALDQAIEESIPLPTLEEVGAIAASVAVGFSPSAEGLYYDPVTQDYFLVPPDRIVDWIVYEELITDFLKKNKPAPIPPPPEQRGVQYREIAFDSYQSFVNSMGELQALLLDFDKELKKSEYEYYDDIPAAAGVPHAGGGQPDLLGTEGVYNFPQGVVLDLKEEANKVIAFKTKMDRFFKLNEESFKGTFKNPEDLGLGDLYKNVNKKIIFGFELTQEPLQESFDFSANHAPIPQLRYVRTESITMKALQEEIAYREKDIKQRVEILKNVQSQVELNKQRAKIASLRVELKDYKIEYHAELMKSMMFSNLFPFDIHQQVNHYLNFLNPSFLSIQDKIFLTMHDSEDSTAEEKTVHFNPEFLVLPAKLEGLGSRPLADENTVVPAGAILGDIPGFDPFQMNKFKVNYLRTFFFLYSINQIASEPGVIDRITAACGFPKPGAFQSAESNSTLAQRVKSASGRSASSPVNKDDKLTADVFVKKYAYSSRYMVMNPGTEAAVVKTLPLNWRLKKVLSDEQIINIHKARAESSTRPMTINELNSDDEWYKRIDVKKVLAKTNKKASDEIGDQLFSALPRRPREIGEVDSITDLFMLVLNKTDIQTIAKEMLACMYLDYSLQDLVEMLCDELLEKAFSPFDGFEALITKAAEEIGLDDVGFYKGKTPEQTFVNFMRAFRSYQVKISAFGESVQVVDGGALYNKMELLFGNWTSRRIDEISGTSFYSNHRRNFDFNEKLFLCEALVYGAIELVNTIIQVFKWAWDYLNGSEEARFERDKIPAFPKCDINFRLPDKLPYLGKILKQLEKKLFETLVKEAEKFITEQVVSQILAWLENCGNSGPQQAGDIDVKTLGLDTSSAEQLFPYLERPEDYLASLFSVFTPGELCQLFQGTATSKLMQDVDIFNRLRFNELYQEYPGIEGIRQLFIDIDGVLDTSVCEFLEDPPCLEDLCDDMEQSLRETKIRAALQRQGYSEDQITLQVAKDRLLQQQDLMGAVEAATDPLKSLKSETNSLMNSAISETPFLKFAGNMATNAILLPLESAVSLDLSNYLGIINQYFEEKWILENGEEIPQDPSQQALITLDGAITSKLDIYDVTFIPPSNPFVEIDLAAPFGHPDTEVLNERYDIATYGGTDFNIRIILPPEITGEASNKTYEIKWIPVKSPDDIGLEPLDQNQLHVMAYATYPNQPFPIPQGPGLPTEQYFSRRIAEAIAHSGGDLEPNDATDTDINGNPVSLPLLKEIGHFAYTDFDLGKYIRATSIGSKLILETKGLNIEESVLEDIKITLSLQIIDPVPAYRYEDYTMQFTQLSSDNWGRKPEHQINMFNIQWLDQRGNNSWVSEGIYDPEGTNFQSDENKGGVYSDIEMVVGADFPGGIVQWVDENKCAEYVLLRNQLSDRLYVDFQNSAAALSVTDKSPDVLPGTYYQKESIESFLDITSMARLWTAMKHSGLNEIVKLLEGSFENLKQYQTLDLENSGIFPIEQLKKISQEAVSVYLQKTDFADPDSNPSAIGDSVQEALIYCVIAFLILEMIVYAPSFSSQVSLEDIFSESQLMNEFLKTVFQEDDQISKFNKKIFEKYAISERINIDTIRKTLLEGIDKKIAKALGLPAPPEGAVSAPNSLLKIYNSTKGLLVMDAPSRNTRLYNPGDFTAFDADDATEILQENFNIKTRISRLWTNNVDADKVKDKGQWWHLKAPEAGDEVLGGWSNQWFEIGDEVESSILDTYEQLLGDEGQPGRFIFETYAKVPTAWLYGDFPVYYTSFPEGDSIYGKPHSLKEEENMTIPDTEKVIVGFPEFKRIIISKLLQAVEEKGGTFNESEWETFFKNTFDFYNFYPSMQANQGEGSEAGSIDTLQPVAWYSTQEFTITNAIDGKKSDSNPRPFFYAAPFVYDSETGEHAGKLSAYLDGPQVGKSPYDFALDTEVDEGGIYEWNHKPINPATGKVVTNAAYSTPSVFNPKTVMSRGLMTDDSEMLRISVQEVYKGDGDEWMGVVGTDAGPEDRYLPSGDVLPIGDCRNDPHWGTATGDNESANSVDVGFWRINATNWRNDSDYHNGLMYGLLTTFHQLSTGSDPWYFPGETYPYGPWIQREGDMTVSGYVLDTVVGNGGKWTLNNAILSHWAKIDIGETKSFKFMDINHPSLELYFNEDCGVKSVKPSYKVVTSTIKVPSIVRVVPGEKVSLITKKSPDESQYITPELPGLTVEGMKKAGIKWPEASTTADKKKTKYFAKVGGDYVWDNDSEIVIVETQPVKIHKIYEIRKEDQDLLEQKSVELLDEGTDNPSPVLMDDFLSDVDFGVRISYVLSDAQIVNDTYLSDDEMLYKKFVMDPMLPEFDNGQILPIGVDASAADASKVLLKGLEAVKSYNFVLKEPSYYNQPESQGINQSGEAMQEKINEKLWQPSSASGESAKIRTLPLASFEMQSPPGGIMKALDHYPLFIGDVSNVEMANNPFLFRGWGRETYESLIEGLRETEEYKNLIENILELKTGAAIMLLSTMGKFKENFEEVPEFEEKIMSNAQAYLDTMIEYINKYPYGKTELDDSDFN